MMRFLYVLLMVLVPIAGCGAASEPELSESLVGIWQQDREGGYEGVYVEYREDGTYDVGFAPGQGAVEWGTWSSDASVVTREVADDSAYCAGMIATMEVEMSDDADRFEGTTLSDECEDGDEEDFETIVFVRYEEGS